MKFLVTGGEGFVGSAVIAKLLQDEEKKHIIISIDNHLTSDGSRRFSQGVKYILGDVADAALLEMELPDDDIDVVFHFAAQSRIQPSFTDPVTTLHNNVQGTIAICEWARRRKVTRFIFSGSSSKHHLATHSSPYAVSKSIGEQICKMYQENFALRVDIIRFYNVYGQGQIMEGPFAAVIGKWINLLKNNKPLTIVGDGQQRRDFTHIDDIVTGLMKIVDCTTPQNPGDAWELGRGENYSMNEIFRMFQRRFPQATQVFVDNQPGNYRETLRENDNAIEKLKWQPMVRLEDYILKIQDAIITSSSKNH